MSVPRVLVLTGYGINCDEETAFAFSRAGADAHIVHINDIIDNKKILDDYQIFVFPGGFSYGDDTGSGKALAGKIRNNLFDEFKSFAARDVLILGICNGFQVIVNLGLVPALASFGEVEVSLEHNQSNRYECRWVDLLVEKDSPCVFTRGLKSLHVPVAHGEGNFFAPAETLAKIEAAHLVPLRYAKSDGLRANGEFPYNPNGAINDIASICDATGRVMGLMPHPERNIAFTHRDDWTFEKERLLRQGKPLPDESEGMVIFRNAVQYFL